MRISAECILACVLAAASLIAGEQFNIFKSYENAAKKPRQYALRRTTHDIKEYLDPLQLKMMKYRKSPDDPRVMFNDKTWSGFDKKQNLNQGEMNRRLASSQGRLQQPVRRIGTAVDPAMAEEQASTLTEEHDPSFLVFSALLMAIFGIIMFIGYGRIRRIKHSSSRQYHQQQQQQQQHQQQSPHPQQLHVDGTDSQPYPSAGIDLEAAAVGTRTSAAIV